MKWLLSYWLWKRLWVCVSNVGMKRYYFVAVMLFLFIESLPFGIDRKVVGNLYGRTSHVILPGHLRTELGITRLARLNSSTEFFTRVAVTGNDFQWVQADDENSDFNDEAKSLPDSLPEVPPQGETPPPQLDAKPEPNLPPPAPNISPEIPPDIPPEINSPPVPNSLDEQASEPPPAKADEVNENIENTENAENAENTENAEDTSAGDDVSTEIKKTGAEKEAVQAGTARQETELERIARENAREAAETEQLGTSPSEVGVTVGGGVTNVELFDALLDTPLKRYNARTKGHIFWRTDALVFISIPFSFLWSTILKSLLRNFSVLGGYFEGARTPTLNAINFTYSSDNYPAGTADPLDIFTWVNLALWPIAVAANDVIDRTSVPKRYERTKERMRANRFYRDILLQNF